MKKLDINKDQKKEKYKKTSILLIQLMLKIIQLNTT